MLSCPQNTVGTKKEKNLGEQRSDAKTEKRVVISGYINGRAERTWGSKNKMWRNHKKIMETQKVIEREMNCSKLRITIFLKSEVSSNVNGK